MKRTIVIAIFLCGLGHEVPAELAFQPQVLLTQGASNSWDVDWNGVEERTYFIQGTADLLSWSYFPGVLHGTGIQSGVFTSNSPKFFVRLLYTDIPTSNFELADFDRDGLGNLAEVTLGTDPFNPDSDHDGLTDGFEVSNNGDPLNNSDGDSLRAVDSDGDGLSDAAELALGTSPTLWDSDGDGVSDAEDVFPLDPDRSISPLPTSTDTTSLTVTLETPANAVWVSGP